MTTLVVSSWELHAATPLAQEAKKRGWKTIGFVAPLGKEISGELAVYTGTDLCDEIEDRFKLKLIEPAWDQLARLPYEFCQRRVEYATIHDLRIRPSSRAFIKPADPRRRVFDAGIYNNINSIPVRRPLPNDLPVLLAEPVEYQMEYRYFFHETHLATGSPYMFSGRPVWQPHGKGGELAKLNQSATNFAQKVASRFRETLPSTFVLDVGLIEDRGWSVVEFNPVWCSSLLGSDPSKILDLLKSAVKRASR